MFNTLDSILKLFNKTVAKLERFEEKKRAKASQIGLKIADMKAEKTLAEADANKAKAISEKIKGLIDG